MNIKGGFRYNSCLCSGNHPGGTQTLLEDMGTVTEKSDKAAFRLVIRKKIFTVKVVKHHQKLPRDLKPIPPESGEKGLPADRFIQY